MCDVQIWCDAPKKDYYRLKRFMQYMETMTARFLFRMYVGFLSIFEVNVFDWLFFRKQFVCGEILIIFLVLKTNNRNKKIWCIVSRLKVGAFRRLELLMKHHFSKTSYPGYINFFLKDVACLLTKTYYTHSV